MTIFQRINHKLKFIIPGKEDKNIIKQFCKNKDFENRVLLFEINHCHGEVIPGYIKYFYDLGYKVDVLMNKILGDLQPTIRVSADYIENIYSCNIRTIKSIMKSEQISKYKYVCSASNTIYITINIKSCPSVVDFLPHINVSQNRLLIVEHHLENLNRYFQNKYKTIILADIPTILDKTNIAIANPHYFGNIKITPKNSITNFIIVGAIENHRRNYHLLISAVKELVDNGIDNFKITVIGWRGKLPNLPKYIKKYFDLKGGIDYPKMYEEVENADFFLPMLDSEDPEHNKYITKTTSGSFQLIYGFRKPCLLAEKFTKTHGFDSDNCLIYKNNSDLAKMMMVAVNMSQKEYSKKQEKLSQYANNLYKNSLNNLNMILHN